MHHQFAVVELYGDLKLAKRRWIETDGGDLLLFVELKVDLIFQKRRQFFTQFVHRKRGWFGDNLLMIADQFRRLNLQHRTRNNRFAVRHFFRFTLDLRARGHTG